MYWKPVMIMLLAIGDGICHYDPSAPTYNELYDDRPVLVMQLSGFSPNVMVTYRYWADSTPYIYPGSYSLYTDAQGRFTGTFSVIKGTTSVSYILMVDENDDSTWDTSDYGVYRSGLSFNGANTITDVLTYTTLTLGTYTTIEAAPASGIKTCIYMPNDQNAWDTGDRNNISKFPKMSTTLYLTDWFNTSQIDSASSTSAAIFPKGNYNETCVTDLDADGLYNGSDTASAASAVTFP